MIPAERLAERRAAIRAALMADPSRSIRSIVAEVGGHFLTASAVRRQLVGSGAIGDGPRVGADGTTYRFRDPRYKDAREPDAGYCPTPEQIRAEAAAIKAEAFAGARGRIRNYGVKLQPRSPRIFRDPSISHGRHQ